MQGEHRFSVTFFLILLIPGMIWYQQTGNLSVYFSAATPPGQLPYVLSKLVGMTALVCIAWQIIITLLDRLQWLSSGWLGYPHRLLGMFILVLMFIHALLFFFAVSLRQEALAWNLWLPNFRDFYHTHLTLGLFGLWVLSLVAVAGWLRSLRPIPWANRLHKLYWLSISLVYFHALAVGSEAQSQAGLLLYTGLGLITLFLGLSYFLRRIKARLVLS